MSEPANTPVATAAPASPAADVSAKKVARPREAVLSKDHLVLAFQARLEKFGLKVSKAKAWTIYKLAFACSYDLAKTTTLSLSGIGRFSVLESQRSVALGKPAKRMRFRTSARTTDLLNSTGDFFTDLHEEVAEEAATASPATPATDAPAAPAAPAVPAVNEQPLI